MHEPDGICCRKPVRREILGITVCRQSVVTTKSQLFIDFFQEFRIYKIICIENDVSVIVVMTVSGNDFMIQIVQGVPLPFQSIIESLNDGSSMLS